MNEAGYFVQSGKQKCGVFFDFERADYRTPSDFGYGFAESQTQKD